MPNWNDANDVLNWLRAEQLKKQQEEEARKRAENEARAIVAQPNPQPSLADQMWRPSAQVDTGIRATNTMQPTQTTPYVEPPIVESARTPMYPQNEMAFTGGPEEEEEKPARDWTEQEINRAGVGLQWRNPWEAWRSGQASYGATYEPAARALTNVQDWWNQTGAPLWRSWTQPAAPGVAEENTQRLASGDLRLSEAGAWTRETPAYQYAEERIQERKDRIAAEQATEPTTGLGQMWQDMGGLRDVGGSLFDVWDYWMWLNTTTPPSQFGGAQEAVEAGNADYFQRGLAKLAEDTQDRPLMAYLAPAGEYVNRRFNPFERYLDFIEWSTGDPTQQGEYGAGGFLAPLGDTTFMQFMNQKLQEYDQQQAWYNKLSPDKRESAKIAFTALQSQGLQAAAKALLDPNDTRPRTERVDSVMNPWAIIVEGMTTDPIDWLSFGVGQVGALGKGGASIIEQFAEQAARRNILDVSVEQAAKNWTEGVKRIQPYIDMLAEGKKVNLYPAAGGKATPRNVINRLNIFAPTEISKTDQDATALWRAIRAVIGDATDKATIVQRLDALANAPQRLVAQGVTGRGTLGNVDVANRLPMLRGIDWLSVPSLKPNKIAEIGNRNELMADIYATVWNKIAPFNGLGTLKPGQRTLIEGVPVVGTVYKGLRFPADVMRSIMSFNYLGLRPGNWFRNAGGGTAMLVGTDAYSLRPITQIADWWGRKGGYMPTPRMANVTQGADITGRTLSGAGEVRDTSWIMTRGPKWWQDFNEKLFNIPYGSTEIKLGNVAVPVGEGAMYARGFDTPGRRAFYGGWNDVINEELVPGLVQMGVPEDTAHLIGRKVLELGNDGSKGDVAQGVRKWVNGQKLPYDLADIGVPLEVLGPDARRTINQVLSDALPDQIDEVAQTVRDIIRQEKTRYGDLLRVSPKDPVGYEWTRTEVLADGADVIDGIVDAARRAGVPNIDEVTQQAQQVVQKHTDAVTNAMQRMSNELSGSLNMPQTWALAEDFWWDLYGRIRPAQKKVDDLSKTAAMRRTPEAWQAKWQGTLEEYSRLSDEIDQLTAQYRQWLLDLNNGGMYARQGQPETFWDYVRQYIGWDEQKFMEAQQITLGPASAEFAEDWEKVISNNRAFVDNSFVSLFNTFQKFPNIDNFDILSAAIKNSKAQGAQVAAYLKPLRERALAGGMKWGEYYRLRDLTWQQYFDNTVLTNTAYARAVILNGLSEGVGSRLRWLDDGGMEWRLEGPAQTAGKWLARNGDGRVEEFSAPLKGERGSVFAVPQEVLDDWNRITNQQGSVVDDILEQVQADNPPTLPGVAGQLPASPARPPMQDLAAQQVKPAGQGNMFAETSEDMRPKMGDWQHYQAHVPDLDITDGMNPREWVRWLSERILKDRDNGGIRGLDVGDMATKGIATLDDAERHILSQLPRWLEGLPNTIPPGLRMQVVDAVDDFLPRFDDALSMAAEVGRQMGDFNMLDFSSRRAVDTALALIFPYHYFWSRMGSRMAALALTKPEFVRAFYSMQRGIETENQQAGLPMRMDGTLRSLNPQSMWRYGNPITYVIPAFQYIQPSPFIDPDEANNDTERWMYKWQQWTPGMFPYLQYMQDAIMDKRAPKRGVQRTDKYQVGDIVPLARIAGYAGAATTGEAGVLAGPQMEMLPPRLRSFLKLGDEWDFGRIGREIAKMVVGGEVDPETARWARDQAYQVQNAVGPLPEEDTEAAREVFERGTQRASVNRLWALLGGWLVGMPIYEYSPEEEAARQVLRERDAQGYDPTTGQGSMAAIKEYEAQPMPGTNVTKGDVYDATREYSSLYPSEGNRPVPPTYPYRQPFNAQRPGVVQATADKRAEAKQIRGEYGPQLDALAEAKQWKEFYALLDEQDQALATLDAKYPSAQPDTDQAALGKELLAEIERSQAQPPTDPTRIGQPQEAIDYYGNYSPEELAVKAAENAEYIAYAMNADKKPPRQKPADMSWDVYNRLRDEYKAAVAADTERLMQNPSALVYGRPVGQTSAGRVDSATPTDKEQATDKKAIRQGAKGDSAGGEGVSRTDSEGRPWSEYWDEYRAFGDDYAKKGEYLRAHPEFAAYYKARYLDEGEEAWWERTLTSSTQAYSSWRGGSFYGGGGGGGYSSYEKPKYIDRGTPAQAYMYRQYPYEARPIKPAVYRAPDGTLYSMNQLISLLGAKPNWRLHS